MKKHVLKILCSVLTMSLILGSTSVFAATNLTQNAVYALTNDEEQSWEFSNSVVTSTHLGPIDAADIALQLRGQFWGSIVLYEECSDAIAKAAVNESLTDIYEKVDFYYTYSGDYSTPYYIKKVVNYYSDAKLTHYISSSTVYYYSDTTYQDL